MRILTVRQPWAWAIIHGGKDVENRVRNIAGAYRGPVAIHAGMRFDQSDEAMSSIWKLARVNPVMQLLVGQPFGTIIGVVDLVDVHPGWIEGTPCTSWGIRYVDHAGQNHLVLENPRALATPIPYTGGLGLRELEEKVVGQIRHQVCLGEHETRCCSPCHHHREGLHVGCVLR